MKMTIDQWQLILETMKAEEERAKALYETKHNLYIAVTERFKEKYPDCKQKDIDEGFKRQHDEYKEAHERLCSIEAVISKIENTEI